MVLNFRIDEFIYSYINLVKNYREKMENEYQMVWDFIKFVLNMNCIIVIKYTK